MEGNKLRGKISVLLWEGFMLAYTSYWSGPNIQTVCIIMLTNLRGFGEFIFWVPTCEGSLFKKVFLFVGWFFLMPTNGILLWITILINFCWIFLIPKGSAVWLLSNLNSLLLFFHIISSEQVHCHNSYFQKQKSLSF